MKSVFSNVRVALLAVALLAVGTQGGAQTAPAPYTSAEYNAYNTATTTPDPQAKIRALEAFIAQYNNPTLVPFANRDLYKAYFGLKNNVKTIEYVDKFLAAGDKVSTADRLPALATRALAFSAGASDAQLQVPEMLTKTREASAQGLTAVNGLTKPANATDEAFNNQKKPLLFALNSVSGMAASYQKDWKGAIAAFKAALAANEQDSSTHYNLAVAYLSDSPTQINDGLWEIGRAVALNIPAADQKKQAMRGRLLQYQQPGCDKLADDQVNQILTLSAKGGERPADLSISSAMDLQTARDDTNNFLPWLQEGGAHANTMWLATCGLEFPEVAVRVMEIVPGDAPDKFTLQVFQAPTTADMQAGTAPNMEVHITGQSDVKKLSKDDLLRFSGTLSAYQPTPFKLTWDDAKVNSDDLQDLTTPGTPAPARGGGGRGGAAPARGRGGA